MTQLEEDGKLPSLRLSLLASGRWMDVGGGAWPNHQLSTTPEYPPLQYTMASPPPVEDQARLLEDALAVVRQQTLLMRRCLETPGKLMDALKCRYDHGTA
jgi:hypothetical protein